MLAYRIADSRHAIYDPSGAMLHGGRWNSVGCRFIYAAQTYAGALLEILVHSNLRYIPSSHMSVDIQIPDSVAVEAVAADDLKGWDTEDMDVSRAFGDRWGKEERTAVLMVPNVVTGGRENNVVINAEHPEFPSIVAAAPRPIYWDLRLFNPRTS